MTLLSNRSLYAPVSNTVWEIFAQNAANGINETLFRTTLLEIRSCEAGLATDQPISPRVAGLIKPAQDGFAFRRALPLRELLLPPTLFDLLDSGFS